MIERNNLALQKAVVGRAIFPPGKNFTFLQKIAGQNGQSGLTRGKSRSWQ
jgi:hypothetical protein